MVSVRFKFILVNFLIPALIQFGNARPRFTSSVANKLSGLAYKFVDKVARPIANIIGGKKDNSTTKTLCKLNTRQLIEYYNYHAEEYSVFTEDHYILTVFRCNSKKPFWGKKKKIVILQHGLITSSDGFTTNIPEHALAYYLAEAGFDVWLPNNRGNFYSRRHVFFNPSDPKFWDFSWFELAIYDCTAVIDFILKETGQDKVFIVGHSQGTTTLMAMLAERPEYNKKVAAASLMAPIGYLNHAYKLKTLEKVLVPLLKMFKYSVFLPRPGLSDIAKTFCSMTKMCDSIFKAVFGPSVNQRDESMIGSFLCHEPSGAAALQVIHYAQELKYPFFGKFMEGSTIPKDFDFSRITVPLTIHYSPTDEFTNPIDIGLLIEKLRHTLEYVQKLEEPYLLSHIDFIWGKNTAKIVYSEIVDFFNDFD